uniref:Putative activating transcription factor n=1 Tax=Tabanus bromius TaxID=304241 RepID=A0A0K8TQZ5_TABBR
MESLQLPQDLFWDGKMEPDSPSSEIFSLPNSEESWVLEDNFAKDILFVHDIDESILLESKPTLIEEFEFKDNTVIVENNEQNIIDTEVEGELLYEFDIKEEQWLDGKPDIQHLMDYASNVVQPLPAVAQLVKVQNDYDIIMELGNMYNNTELTQLTPPQTPPQSQDVVGMKPEVFDIAAEPQYTPFTQYDTVKDSNVLEMSPASSMLDYSSDISSNAPVSPAIAREMQIVDDILANRIKDLPDLANDDSMYSMTSSSLSQSNDEDWLPSTSSIGSPSTPKILDGGITKRRVRPYGRCIEDKKSRKKEQNKNAATRYRQKKKQEMDEILEEERQLNKRNEELKKNVSEVRREVKYLRQLVRELYKARGLLK